LSRKASSVAQGWLTMDKIFVGVADKAADE
jgi:hypothetical protein